MFYKRENTNIMKKRIATFMVASLAASAIFMTGCNSTAENTAGSQESDVTDSATDESSDSGDASTALTSEDASAADASTEGDSSVDADAESDLDSSSDASTEASSEETGDPLTAAELNTFNKMINAEDGYGFLLSSYSSPEDINWNEVLYAGAGIDETGEYAEGEEDAILAALEIGEMYTDVTRITSDKLEEFVEAKTGTSYADANNKLDWIYLSDYDTYYNMHGDTNYCQFTVESGYRNDDVITLRVVPAGYDGETVASTPGSAFELTLTETADGNYLYTSNRLLWEEGALSDIVETELTEYEGTSYFVAYPTTVGTSISMKIINSDEIKDILSTYAYEENPITSVKDIDFIDYNCDGFTDIILLATTSDGDKVLIYDGFDNSSEDSYGYFEYNENLSNAVMENIATVTMNNVKKVIYDGEGQFETWQEAYSNAAQLYYMENGDDATFDLIYINSDDVPELVAGVTGYKTSIYTYVDGSLVMAAHDWPYGVGGNYGYEYAKEQNLIRNVDSEYAGAIIYTTFYALTENGTLEKQYFIKSINFDDVNGNGYLDEDEESTVGQVVMKEYLNGETEIDLALISEYTHAEATFEEISSSTSYLDFINDINNTY